MTASGSWDQNHAPKFGRLNKVSSVSNWASRVVNVNQWFQVDIGSEVTVGKVAIQGRYNYEQWITSFKISYSLDGVNFTLYNNGEILAGNSDRNTVVAHSLKPFQARYVRFLPVTWRGHISGRFEVYKRMPKA